MKLFKSIAKLAAAIVAVAGIAYVVYKYMDAIKAWLSKLCPCAEVELEEDFVPEEEVAAEAAEEAPAEETPAEEVPAEEAPAAEDNAPVAEETDFEA